jgi:hypothetical protein
MSHRKQEDYGKKLRSCEKTQVDGQAWMKKKKILAPTEKQEMKVNVKSYIRHGGAMSQVPERPGPPLVAHHCYRLLDDL